MIPRSPCPTSGQPRLLPAHAHAPETHRVTLSWLGPLSRRPVQISPHRSQEIIEINIGGGGADDTLRTRGCVLGGVPGTHGISHHLSSSYYDATLSVLRADHLSKFTLLKSAILYHLNLYPHWRLCLAAAIHNFKWVNMVKISYIILHTLNFSSHNADISSPIRIPPFDC